MNWDRKPGGRRTARQPRSPRGMTIGTFRNKIEGLNRSRGEAAETVHHIFMAYLKGYESKETYDEYRTHYQECIRMINGMERTLEKQLPEMDRGWPLATVHEDLEDYSAGFPEP